MTSLDMNLDNYFARMQRGQVPPPPICSLLGGRIGAVDLKAGTLESAYHATPAFLNPAGQVQRGMLGAMLDDVTAMLVTASRTQISDLPILDLSP